MENMTKYNYQTEYTWWRMRLEEGNVSNRLSQLAVQIFIEKTGIDFRGANMDLKGKS